MEQTWPLGQPCTLPLAVIAAGLPSGATLLDLGAHTGTVALPAAGWGLHVVAVEAAPSLVRSLRARARGVGPGTLRVVHAAVGDRVGQLGFVEDGLQGHVATDPAEATVLVPATTVDALLAELDVPVVDLVKIDVEGHEPAVLRGMAQLLSRADAPAVLCESNGPRLAVHGESPRSLLATLAGYGYHSYLALPGRLVPVEPGDLQPSCVVDYLAVRELAGPWRGWLAPPMTEPERRARIEAERSSPDPVKRAWIAAQLAAAATRDF